MYVKVLRLLLFYGAYFLTVIVDAHDCDSPVLSEEKLKPLRQCYASLLPSLFLSSPIIKST